MASEAHHSRDIHRTILRRRTNFLIVGALGLALTILLLFSRPEHFFQGYLVGFTFWIGASLGCLAILMLHHLVAGEWGFIAQRILEAGAATIGLMAVFFIPVIFGMSELYEWTRPAAVEHSVVLQHKKPYLNVPFFAVRALVYFAVWTAIALLLVRWSTASDKTRQPRYAARMRRLSAGGLIAYVVLMTLASVDWVMSIEPHWYSSVYGWMLQGSQVLVAISLVIVLVTLLGRADPLARVVKTKHFHDWGNLLLTFVILWAYLMFTQFMIIWSGNVPEDVEWYVHRTDGPWQYLGLAMIGLHFVAPFLLLLFRRVKRGRRALAAVAGGIFFVHLLFVAWLILPGFGSPPSLVKFLTAVASWIGIGGCWMTAMLTRLAARPLLPVYDPRFERFLEERAVS